MTTPLTPAQQALAERHMPLAREVVAGLGVTDPDAIDDLIGVAYLEVVESLADGNDLSPEHTGMMVLIACTDWIGRESQWRDLFADEECDHRCSPCYCWP